MKFSSDEVVQMLWKDGLSVDEIADKANCTGRSVYNFMRKHDIETRASKPDILTTVWSYPEQTRERAEMDEQHLINFLYHEKGMSLTEVGDELDVERKTVHKRMKYYDIPRRGKSEGRVAWLERNGYELDTSEDRLRELYIEEHTPVIDIASIYDVSPAAVKTQLDRYGIEHKSFQDVKTKRMMETMDKGPSKPEKRFISICEEYDLPYEYVGGGDLEIDGIYPDFVDRGSSHVVEIFGEPWHDPTWADSIDVPYHKTEWGREEILGRNSYDLTVLWTEDMSEMSDEEIADTVSREEI